MSEQAGLSVAALKGRQSELADRHGAAAEADRVLTEVLVSAHAAIRESVRRLDAIAEEIDRAAVHQSELAVDTPLGAREFQRFLAAKQHEIATVVADARELGRAQKVALDRLWEQYAAARE